MLNEIIARNVISEGLQLGADFVEVFVEKNRSSNLSFLDKKVKDIKTGTDFGIGLRTVYGKKVLYGYTNSPHQEELIRIIRLICSLEKSAVNPLRPKEFANLSLKNHHPALLGLDKENDHESKISYLRQIDQAARQNSLIKQVELSVIQRWQKVEIFNSEGLHAEDERHYTRLFSMAIAQEGNQQSSAFHGPGGLKGWETLQALDPQEIAEIISRRAITTLRADHSPGGKMPVVIDNGFGGVIFHEACGHLLETTSVEKKASVFHDKMNQMIAHPAVSAVDDGTLLNEWGSINIDDEGMPTQRTQLIKDGKLVSFLVDKMGELKTGFKRTGSGRRQSYKFAPASRMRNTFIEPGPYSLEDLISSMEYGLYAKTMGGGSVQPGTGEFNFSVEEAYIVKNGKIQQPVKGATLIGTGPEAMTKISMVGNNFKVSPGMCGSVSGSIPVTVGQPALKIDEILVGGKA